MNKWLAKSIKLAQEQDYLDRLQKVYKLPNNERRELDKKVWDMVVNAYENKNDIALIKSLLQLELFPIKHSFVAYFRRDPASINRNPKTVEEIARVIYNLGIEAIKIRCEEPKETNRQIGPLFKNYLMETDLGITKNDATQFRNHSKDAIHIGSDDDSKKYANEKLGYKRNKGLDFLARINGRHIIGEAKFLTDFGGHQNAQLDDAYSTLKAHVDDADKILILDGVLFINNTGKMYQTITQEYQNENIMSAILLKEFIAEKISET